MNAGGGLNFWEAIKSANTKIIRHSTGLSIESKSPDILRGGGGLDNHIDPTKNQRVIIGAMMSKRGVDYETGGFYCVDANMERVDFEPHLDVGDMVCAYPTMVHGVTAVDADKPLEWKSREGRWFLGLYSNDSNHIKKRTTVARLTNLENYIAHGSLN